MHHGVMATCVAALMLSGVVGARLSARLPPQAAADGECRLTPVQHLLPDVVGPMQGQYPVWIVTGTLGWRASDTPVKILWVVARDHPGDLVVTGRLRDAASRARFLVRSAVADSTLHIRDATVGGVLPGDAPDSVIRRYAFHPSLVLFPEPGCWELHSTIGSAAHVITLEVESRPD